MTEGVSAGRDQTVSNYTERDVIVGLQCINPHYKDECSSGSSVALKPSAAPVCRDVAVFG